jgi:hypothetical protein
MAEIILHRKALLLIGWLALAAAVLWWRQAPDFKARWVAMPSSINLETYLAARKARPAYCICHNFGQCWTG